MVFNLIRGDTQKRSFLVLKEGRHLVTATEPVSQEESAMHRVSGVMMRLEPSGEVPGKIGRLLEERTIRPDVATVYALQDAAQAWNDIARTRGFMGCRPVSREGQDASHTARSYFVWPRNLQRKREPIEPSGSGYLSAGSVKLCHLRLGFSTSATSRCRSSTSPCHRRCRGGRLMNTTSLRQANVMIDDLLWWTAALKTARER